MKWQAENSARLNAGPRLAWRQRSPRQSLNVSLSGALKRHPTVNPATVDELMELWDARGGMCALSGLRMTWAQGKLLPTSITLDRIDQTQGYHVHNLRLVCHAVNTFRGSMTDAEMLAMARAIVAYLGRDKFMKGEAQLQPAGTPMPAHAGFL